MARNTEDWQTISLPIEREMYHRARVAAATAGKPTVEFIRDAIARALDELPKDALKQSIDGSWSRLSGPSRATLYRVALALDDAETMSHGNVSAEELAALDETIKDAAVEYAKKEIKEALDCFYYEQGEGPSGAL